MKTAKDLKIPFTWEERYPVVVDRFFYIPGAYDYQKKSLPFFDDDKPIVIEYCSGNGQWIGERAKQAPGTNWIAVEKRFDRARKIWLLLHRENLSNLFVVCGEGLIFTRYYAPKAAEVYVNFPDPWPKSRHSKHRIVRREFIQELEEITLPKAKVTCVTDDAGYALEMAKEFAKCPSWQPLFHTTSLPDYGNSYFNDLWIQMGRTIHYLVHEKR